MNIDKFENEDKETFKKLQQGVIVALIELARFTHPNRDNFSLEALKMAQEISKQMPQYFEKN